MFGQLQDMFLLPVVGSYHSSSPGRLLEPSEKPDLPRAEDHKSMQRFLQIKMTCNLDFDITLSITKPPPARAGALFLSKCLLPQNTVLYYICYTSVFHDRILYVGDM